MRQKPPWDTVGDDMRTLSPGKATQASAWGTRHMKELIWQFNVWHFCRKCHPERLVVSLWIQAQRHSTFTYTRRSSRLHLQCRKARRTFYVAQHFCGKDLPNFAEKCFLQRSVRASSVNAKGRSSVWQNGDGWWSTQNMSDISTEGCHLKWEHRT